MIAVPVMSACKPSGPSTNSSNPNRNTPIAKERFGLTNRERTKMKNTRRQNCTRVALVQHINQVFQRPCSTTGNHRYGDRVADGARQA